jgi:hypothetical protein
VLGAGCEEQAGERVGLLRAARRLLYALVVVDGALREDELVGQAVPDEDLASVLLEPREAGVVGGDGACELAAARTP